MNAENDLYKNLKTQIKIDNFELHIIGYCLDLCWFQNKSWRWKLQVYSKRLFNSFSRFKRLFSILACFSFSFEKPQQISCIKNAYYHPYTHIIIQASTTSWKVFIKFWNYQSWFISSIKSSCDLFWTDFISWTWYQPEISLFKDQKLFQQKSVSHYKIL